MLDTEAAADRWQPVQAIDVVDIEVFRNALENITQEMAITIKRVSGSPVVYETHDFSTAVFDADGEQLAFAGLLSMHCASSLLGMRETVRLYKNDPHLRRGDAIVVNDPYTSGALHQADAGIAMPIFADTELVGWCFSNVHLLDIGGCAIGGLASTAHDVWEEALRFERPTRIAPGGLLDPQWEHFIAGSVRMPAAVLNDLRGMIAAGNVAQHKIEALVGRYGTLRYRQYSQAAKDLSEIALRRRVAELPDGVFTAAEWVEYDGHGKDEALGLRCTMQVSGESMRIEFSGTTQIDAPVLGTRGAMMGNVMAAMLCMLTYDIPLNEGIWRHVIFDFGEAGTVVNPVPPGPVSLGLVGAGFRASRAFNDVMSQICGLSGSDALRSRVAGMPQNSVPCGMFFGQNQFGQPTMSVVLSTSIGVGGGAQSVGDGQDCYAAQSMLGTRMPEVEIFEAQQPFLVLHRRLICDSGGAGAYRGGLGMSEAVVVWSTDTMRSMTHSHCERIPPRGASGGYPGAAGGVSSVRKSNVRLQFVSGHYPQLDSSETETWAAYSSGRVWRDDVVVMQGGGGGGLGDPLRRDPTLVRCDVAEDKVSRELALEVYGVVLGAGDDVDEAATLAQRESLRRARLGWSADRDLPTQRNADPTVAVVLQHTNEGSFWACAACRYELCAIKDNWRGAARSIQRSVTATFTERRQYIRPRVASPAAVERQRICPGCGFLLAVDIALDGDPDEASPILVLPANSPARDLGAEMNRDGSQPRHETVRE